MSTYADLRDAIEAILEGINDIGQVYDYRPHKKTDAGYLSAFSTILDAEDNKQVVQAWIVNSPTEMPRYTWHQGGFTRNFTFIVQGYRAVGSYEDDDDVIPEGATEKPFRDLCDLVLRTLMANPALIVDDVSYALGYRSPPTLRTFGAINLGPVLCHYCEIVLSPFTSCFLTLGEV